ncbi:hypothetical protein FEM48_Zijuj01G0144900 [Ziziphus jujuba var. spinosa]|uniref:F-box domain-containing protein n=1 Tax=Ziziphus jujuba var. spinosa TaxID=714518 RepID=A0A978W1T2_ZIZJJ|nr:hypothetical protein FEM48_Zijuj01G0144900 [Ziziphus jujuba var. spinosa]
MAASSQNKMSSQIALPIQPPQKRTRRLLQPHNLPHILRAATDLINGANNRNSFNLPDDIIENIFSFLPIKHGVKIGVVSKRFKTSWLFSRKLLFDRDFARPLSRHDFISIVNRVFDSHMGSKIQCLRLYFDPTGSEFMVLNWIKKSTEKGVEELDLDFLQARDPFNLPWNFLDVESVRILKLWYCVINFPTQLKGLRLLSTVILRKVDLNQTLIETLIQHCALLETLDLTQCDGIRELKVLAGTLKRFKVLKVGNCFDMFKIDIDSPTLRSLYYHGPVRDLKVANPSQLKDVMLNFTPSKGFIRSSQVENLVSDISRITLFTTTSTFLEGLTTRIREGVFRDLHYCFWNLKEFQLFMEGASYCNLCDIASFLAKCPRIEKLFIDLNEFSFECGLYWELHQKQLLDKYSAFFYCLKFIKVKGFKFQKHELELVRYFLGKALLLKTLVLVFPRNGRVTTINPPEIPIYNSLFLSWKVSPNAKIVIYEHFNDRSSFHAKQSKIWF